MPKRFAFISFGVLCLMVSAVIESHLDGQSAVAQEQGPIFSETGIVTHFAEWMLDENGRAWEVRNGWHRSSPDVPAWLFSQIKFWHLTVIITEDNTAWEWIGGEWVTTGPWPGGAVPSAESTIGTVKDKYRVKN